MMKRSLLAFAAASCAGHAAAPSRPAEPRELRTTLSPRVVGLVLEEDSLQVFDVTIDGVHAVERTGQKSKARVLAVADGRITKLATTYLEYTFDVHHGDEVQPVPPLAGHTYIVTVDGDAIDGLHVEREHGEELSQYERRAVLQDHKDLGKGGGSEELFASRPWRLGEAVALDAAQQEVFLGEPSKGKLTLKLVELTGTAAQFEVEGERTYADGVSAAVHGQITLDPRTGRMIARTGTAQLTGLWIGHAEQRATWRETPPPPGP